VYISPEGEVIVRAPLKMSEEYIRSFVESKARWIAKHQHNIRQRTIPQRTFSEGEIYCYLGNAYPLQFCSEQAEPLLLTDKICIAERHKGRAEKVLTRWLQAEAGKYIPARLEYFTTLLGITIKSFRLSNAGQRWGSCSVQGGINLSWRLIMAPPDIIDYVIVHELMHISRHDHSKAFWKKVEAILPDYRERRKWLKNNANNLHLWFK